MHSPSSPDSINAKKRKRCGVSSRLFAAGLLLLGACGDAAVPAVEPDATASRVALGTAPGVAVLVDDVAIPRAEIERWAGWVKACEPRYVENACRRFALTNGLLDRAAVAGRFPEERAAAEQLAREAAAVLRAAQEPLGMPAEDRLIELGGIAAVIEGTWHQIGLQVWGELQPVAIDRWIGPFEQPGIWSLARVLEKELVRDVEVFRVEIVNYAYLASHDALADVTDAVDQSKLTIVDTVFDTAIPESWKYRMRGRDQ